MKGVGGIGFSLMTGGNFKPAHRESGSVCSCGGVPFLGLGWWGVQSVDNSKNEGETSQIGKDQSDLCEIFTLTGDKKKPHTLGGA
jgi:hypothetical protein